MKTRWYKDALIYQIYPRSFFDANGDGIGDIKGIIEKLDYIAALGVNAVWLSPCYSSPNDDNGYDVSDYRNIMTEYGTLSDFKLMLDGLHKRGIRLVMDLVANHTSDEHEWFKKSRESRDNPYRDYYIWRDGRGPNGKRPPNNWTSRFSGSAWKYDEKTGQWYLHLFSEKQPDLNWDNPKVREEVADICRFWFELGVDGFRCDVITYISKSHELPNGRFRLINVGDEHFVLGERIHEYLHEISEKAWQLYDSLIVGEAVGVSHRQVEAIIKEERGELDSVISFDLMQVDMKMNIIPTHFRLRSFKRVIEKWQSLPSDCWNTLYYENHDQPRSTSRYGNAAGEHLNKLAKMLAVSLIMRRGTPYIYQGQEIGMTNCAFAPEEYNDVASVKISAFIKEHAEWLLPYAYRVLQKRARENARTPMQWSNEANAGFSVSTPWIKVNPNYSTINVKNQLNDEDSVLSFYKKLIHLRLHNDIIINGSFKQYYKSSPSLFVFERALDDKSLLVICSFKEKNLRFKVPRALKFAKSSRLVNNYCDSPQSLSDFILRPYEAAVYLLEK